MLMNTLVFLILGCNAIIVSSKCPNSQAWRNTKISPGGPLVCARLYGDEKCSGFPLPFAINSSTSDLGIESSSIIDFMRNNVTALVRPGCNMFLWEGANFTGRLEKSVNYKWHVDHRHYSSALCNCSVDDVELLQCELREEWEELNSCNFLRSDVGGLCSFTLKHSYIEDGDGVARNVTITKNLTNLFADKMIGSFGEELMTSFLDDNSNDKLAHSIWVGAMTEIKLKQRYYICGKYRLFTPEVVKDERKDENVLKLKTVLKFDKWIYNRNAKTEFWISSVEESYDGAKNICKNANGQLARFYTAELKNWIQPLLAQNPLTTWWIHERHAEECLTIYHDIGVNEIDWSPDCEKFKNYICERE